MRKLSLDEIKSITVGALSVQEIKGYLHFYKCTEKQMDAWRAMDINMGFRAETTSGIRLDFHTDSSMFAFKVKEKSKYEIYIDDVLRYVYDDAEFEESLEQAVPLDGNRHRVTLYLPGHAIGILEWIKLDDEASIEPHRFDCNILFLGDSITQGWNSTWDSLSYAQRVSRFFNANSVIQGIGGAIYHHSTFDGEIEFEPDIVIVAYGTNDWLFYDTVEEARAECSQFSECITDKYQGKKIFGISPIWRGDKDTKHRMGTFDVCTAYIKDEIKRHGMILVDGDELTPHHSAFYSDEYLHPNAVGHGLYAEKLIRKMLQHL